MPRATRRRSQPRPAQPPRVPDETCYVCLEAPGVEVHCPECTASAHVACLGGGYPTPAVTTARPYYAMPRCPYGHRILGAEHVLALQWSSSRLRLKPRPAPVVLAGYAALALWAIAMLWVLHGLWAHGLGTYLVLAVIIPAHNAVVLPDAVALIAVLSLGYTGVLAITHLAEVLALTAAQCVALACVAVVATQSQRVAFWTLATIAVGTCLLAQPVVAAALTRDRLLLAAYWLYATGVVLAALAAAVERKPTLVCRVAPAEEAGRVWHL